MMMFSLNVMTMRKMSMVTGFLMVTREMMLMSLVMVFGSVLMVLSSMGMMLGGFFGMFHNGLPNCERDSLVMRVMYSIL